jgi:lipoprotein LpqH
VTSDDPPPPEVPDPIHTTDAQAQVEHLNSSQPPTGGALHDSTGAPIMRKVHITSILGAAAVAVALTACGSDDSSSSGSTDAEASVTVDGKELELSDKTVGCTDTAGKVTIGIGSGSGSGIGVVLTSGDSPEVESVGLGSLDGVTLGYQKGAGQGSAEVTKDGDTYTVSGEASGIDLANPTQQVTKAYEIKVTCP